MTLSAELLPLAGQQLTAVRQLEFHQPKRVLLTAGRKVELIAFHETSVEFLFIVTKQVIHVSPREFLQALQKGNLVFSIQGQKLPQHEEYTHAIHDFYRTSLELDYQREREELNVEIAVIDRLLKEKKNSLGEQVTRCWNCTCPIYSTDIRCDECGWRYCSKCHSCAQPIDGKHCEGSNKPDEVIFRVQRKWHAERSLNGLRKTLLQQTAIRG